MSEQDPSLPEGWVVEGELTGRPADEAPVKEQPSSSSSLALLMGGKAIPVAARAAMEFATSPTAAKTGSTIGQGIGAIAAPIVGAMKAGPLGGMVGAAEMGKAA